MNDAERVDQAGLDITIERDANPGAAIEALLFASPEGETIGRLAAALQWSMAETRDAVECFERELAGSPRGLLLQRSGDELQLVTAPRYGPAIQRLHGLERTVRLSGAALETLALIAYRQPVTRSEIEAVRGVDSASVVSTLLARELIDVVGKRSTPGTPTEYGTSATFLQMFGLSSLDALPRLSVRPEVDDGQAAPGPGIIQPTPQVP
jgi:segregation and condensation protein B